VTLYVELSLEKLQERITSLYSENQSLKNELKRWVEGKELGYSKITPAHNTDGYPIPPTMEELEERVRSLETQLKMSLNDWIEACRDFDKLKEQMIEALQKVKDMTSETMQAIEDSATYPFTYTDIHFFIVDALEKVGVKT
jgi:hypothetical protein